MRRSMMAMVALVMLALAMLPSTTLAQSGQGYVSVMHASPDSPAVDVYLNGARVLSDVSFFSASRYLPVAAGSYTVQVTAAGEPTSEALIQGSVTVQAGQYSTIAAVNTLDNIEAVTYADTFTDPPAGTARVNLIHAAPDAVAVDVKIAGTSTAVFSNVKFKDGVELEVPAGTYTFDITPAGSATVAFTTPTLRFENGWIYTLVATGEVEKGGFWIQSVVDYVP